ncbi:bifunctional adenosylcobinamide kinase/adenosylcobinamide-phosphate guanylyltransferase [Desulfonatronospira sp.]|uniref:bifunctional adenosylcobinamide kinase/adenosylcobinamide-phosphate guanylyltransferase n=1 Tax=Desulfonatronospira sp. TaxID=1962951 RepID=UPI0025C46316|nr:bifunctional adenosylcobinamide kinase/adenosylcobinamide-phosphate guanylyltransferase [Desulfonatronospira sp.]
MNRTTYISGGCRSGKSSFALQLMQSYQRKVYIATAQAVDTEMQQRIQKHQQERGQSFITVEEPLDPAQALSRLPGDTQAAVLDCLTVWLGNLMHHSLLQEDTCPLLENLFSVLEKPPCDVFLVSNELGMGLVPGDPLSRRYRDTMGRVNQRASSLAHQAYFVVSGMPLRLK